MYRPRKLAEALVITACALSGQATAAEYASIDPHGAQFCPSCYFGKDPIVCAERRLHFAALCPEIRERPAATGATEAVERSITVLAKQRSVGPSGMMSVSWSVSTSGARDRIGLFKSGIERAEPVWQIRTGGAAVGNAVFTAPEETGSYEFRYFDAAGLVAAQSDTVNISPLTVILDATPEVSADGMLTVDWSASNGRSSEDWVGLHRVGDPDGRYCWQHETHGAACGTFSMYAPAGSGAYEFRYFSVQSPERIAHSNQLAIGASAAGAPVLASK
jgi:hypothetical protein